jgi:hypothetical protein
MHIDDCEVIQLELKYCERCGGLWLRLQGGGEIYCANCAYEEAEHPVSIFRNRRPHLLKSDRVDGRAQLIELTAICGEGGNA